MREYTVNDIKVGYFVEVLFLNGDYEVTEINEEDNTFKWIDKNGVVFTEPVENIEFVYPF